MVTIYDAAKYILEKKGSLNSVKLQKLLYYSQAWSLVWDDVPLFLEDFEAWDSGPVCRPLRERFEGQLYLTADDIPDGDSTKLSDVQRETVDVVLEKYGHWDTEHLVLLTQAGAPWRETWNAYQTRQIPSRIIPIDSLGWYYGGAWPAY